MSKQGIRTAVFLFLSAVTAAVLATFTADKVVTYLLHLTCMHAVLSVAGVCLGLRIGSRCAR